MLRETAQVKSVRGSEAIIVTESKLACAGCKAASGCGNGIVEGYLAPKMFETPVANHIGAKPGDKVLVEIEESVLTRASLLVYTLPLLSMFLFSAVVDQMTRIQFWVACSGLLGLGLGILLVRYLATHHLHLKRYEPRILPILQSAKNDDARDD